MPDDPASDAAELLGGLGEAAGQALSGDFDGAAETAGDAVQDAADAVSGGGGGGGLPGLGDSDGDGDIDLDDLMGGGGSAGPADIDGDGDIDADDFAAATGADVDGDGDVDLDDVNEAAQDQQMGNPVLGGTAGVRTHVEVDADASDGTVGAELNAKLVDAKGGTVQAGGVSTDADIDASDGNVGAWAGGRYGEAGDAPEAGFGVRVGEMADADGSGTQFGLDAGVYHQDVDGQRTESGFTANVDHDIDADATSGQQLGVDIGVYDQDGDGGRSESGFTANVDHDIDADVTEAGWRGGQIGVDIGAFEENTEDGRSETVGTVNLDVEFDSQATARPNEAGDNYSENAQFTDHTLQLGIEVGVAKETDDAREEHSAGAQVEATVGVFDDPDGDHTGGDGQPSDGGIRDYDVAVEFVVASEDDEVREEQGVSVNDGYSSDWGRGEWTSATGQPSAVFDGVPVTPVDETYDQRAPEEVNDDLISDLDPAAEPSPTSIIDHLNRAAEDRRPGQDPDRPPERDQDPTKPDRDPPRPDQNDSTKPDREPHEEQLRDRELDPENAPKPDPESPDASDFERPEPPPEPVDEFDRFDFDDPKSDFETHTDTDIELPDEPPPDSIEDLLG